MSNEQPISMFAGFTVCDTWLSRAICRLTGFEYSHCLVGFRFVNRYPVYYEALLSNGFQGPKALDELVEWGRKPGNKYSLIELSIPKPDCAMKLAICESWVGAVGYSAWQLLRFYFAIRCGWDIVKPFGGVVCSEAVARILFPEIDCKGEKLFDAVTPGDVWERVTELQGGRVTG